MTPLIIRFDLISEVQITMTHPQLNIESTNKMIGEMVSNGINKVWLALSDAEKYSIFR